jgi:4'-phosphopantetheinyl transferase
VIDVWVEHLPRFHDSRTVAVLATSERERADRMRSSTARTHYVTAHGWMHERLADLLEVPPAEVPVRVDECGVPSLDGGALQLSFSHHRDLLALAVSSGHPVGVDVLGVPDDAGFVADTALVLSPCEITLVRSSPSDRRGTVFAHCWTRKEAYAKLRRTGLTAHLATVTLTPFATEPSAPSLWSRELPDAVVAVATTAPGLPDVRLRLRLDGTRQLAPSALTTRFTHERRYSPLRSARSEGFEPPTF